MDTPQATSSNASQTLADILVNFKQEDKFEVELSIRENGRVIFFHSHDFTTRPALFEFNLNTYVLSLIFENDHRQTIGQPLPEQAGAQMHNAHQILTVLIDPQTGEVQNGHYVPLILLST